VSDPVAVAKLYKLKNREQKPGTVIAANIDQLERMGIAATDLADAGKYWPNPISIVLPSNPSLSYVDQGKGSLALRIPKSPAFITFLEQTGPLVTSSANMPGLPPANTIAEAETYFGDDVDFYVDGGDLSSREASTIIGLKNGKVKIFRTGAVKIDENGRVIK
jgi:tRNA threonylcarbamoyl adenosine modification protein (Sua5/YciO/YrdC/YwlC family)